MKVNTIEALGIGISIGAMATALWLLRLETSTSVIGGTSVNDNKTVSVIAKTDGNQNAALADAVIEGSNSLGHLEKIVIDDISFGTGPATKAGDKITVEYIGSLRNGQEFDNTYLKNQPFTFTLGDNKVISGWEYGLLGMQVGGQRVLVIPPEYGYGAVGAGPIPADATLVFAIELLSIE